MKIKLRGKTWKQITPEEYIELEGQKTAMFLDTFYDEKTYFKEVNIREESKWSNKMCVCGHEEGFHDDTLLDYGVHCSLSNYDCSRFREKKPSKKRTKEKRNG